MKHFFNHYYQFSENRVHKNLLYLTCKYGYYSCFENETISDLIDNIKISNLEIYHFVDGKTKITNPFFNETTGYCEAANTNDTIVVVFNSKYKTVEFFISDSSRAETGAFIPFLTTKEELQTAMNLMRQKAFSMS